MLNDKQITDNLDDIITTLRNQILKEYREYDGTNRLSRIVQTYTTAKNGEYALETNYFYEGASNRIVYKYEAIVNWDSSWEQS